MDANPGFLDEKTLILFAFIDKNSLISRDPAPFFFDGLFLVDGVADCPNQTFSARQSRTHASAVPCLVDGLERLQSVPAANALAGF